MNGPVTWIISVLAGVATMLVFEQAFRTGNPIEIVPLAQALGLWVAWIVAWPYFRSRAGRTSFARHVLGMGAVSFLIAALRITFKVG
jgi:hypothetical protein